MFRLLTYPAEYLLFLASHWYCSHLLPVFIKYWLLVPEQSMLSIEMRSYTPRPPSSWFDSISVHSWPCVSSLFVASRSSLFLTFRPSLNSRDNLRETLDGQGGAAIMLSQLNGCMGTTTDLCEARITTEAITSAGVSKSLLPANVSSDASQCHSFWRQTPDNYSTVYTLYQV